MAAPRIEPKLAASASSGGRPASVGDGASLDDRPGEWPVAIAIVAIITAVFVWWALKEGAYFGPVFFPGSVLLYGLLITLLIAGPFHGRLAGPVRVALAALVGIAGWTFLSIFWTPSRDAAVQDAERAMLYSAMFLLGLWSCRLAGRRMLLPLGGIAALGVVIGVITTLTLAHGTDLHSYFDTDATLQFPIGYRNADGAFFLICLWPLIALAAEGNFRWLQRALLIGGGTMLLELAVLAESRGSLPAAIVALAVFLALSPRRLRAAMYLTLAALPVLPALPTLLDVFQHGRVDPGLLPLARHASHVIVLSSLGSIAFSALCIRFIEFRLHLGRQRVQLLSRVAAAVAVVAVVLGGTAYLVQRGGPVKFVDQRLTQFNRGGDPNLRPNGTRFGVNVGSNRGDFWRVALRQAEHHPLLGGGAGSFSISYLQDRRSSESPQDPHSVEMLMLGELGLIGLALFGAMLVASALAAVSSRRMGRPAAALVAGSMGAGAYWLMHASYDWFWHYPVMTAPVIFLLGAAGAPYLIIGNGGQRSWRRWTGVAVLGVAIVVAVPLFLSESYSDRAYAEYPSNPSLALSDLNRAASLDPYDPGPLLAKGLIESRLGQGQKAISSFRDAVNREPDGYASHFFLARALSSTDLAAARAEARDALRLNPLGPETRALNRRLQNEGVAAVSKKSQK